MTPKSFEYTAKLYQFEEFKKKLIKLKQDYKNIQKKFNDLCDELDCLPLNEAFIEEISANLTIYLSEMDLIDENIKQISQIIDKIKLEISN